MMIKVISEAGINNDLIQEGQLKNHSIFVPKREHNDDRLCKKLKFKKLSKFLINIKYFYR